MKPKVIAIVGPTAAGKTGLSLKLARRFNGEVISADSRQVYRGMDLGTGKASKQEQRLVPHHLLDVAPPKKQYTVAHFKRDSQKAIKQIIGRGRLPFVVGGTAFYVYSLLDDWELPAAKPNPKLRKALAKKSLAELFVILKNLDPARAKQIDRHNPARLIRAIEINVQTGQTVPQPKRGAPYDVLYIGIKQDWPKLFRMISKRLDQRLKQGMVREVKTLLKQGISHRRLQTFGLEYGFVSRYLQGQMSRAQMRQGLEIAIRHFARRQMTWFKKDPRIHWVKNVTAAGKLVNRFLT